jgi:hypothetical protein
MDFIGELILPLTCNDPDWPKFLHATFKGQRNCTCELICNLDHLAIWARFPPATTRGVSKLCNGEGWKYIHPSNHDFLVKFISRAAFLITHKSINMAFTLVSSRLDGSIPRKSFAQRLTLISPDLRLSNRFWFNGLSILMIKGRDLAICCRFGLGSTDAMLSCRFSVIAGCCLSLWRSSFL